MPIIVKDVTWEETEKITYITVPLKGVKPSTVDIFSTDEFVKVNYPPYLWECALCAPVHEERSVTKVGDGVVVFQLEKKQSVLWNHLHHPDQANKEKMKIRRELAISRYEEKQAELSKNKAEDKRHADKYALKEQMKLEDEERTRIENLKVTERQNANKMLDEWKKEQEVNGRQLQEQMQMMPVKSAGKQVISKVTSTVSSAKEQHIFDVVDKEQENDVLPLRDSGKIQVSFTPRVFPTPSRESQAPEEEAWLKKQAEYRHVAELEDANLSQEEKNPVWLRDKGNEFFKGGNYGAAINAFSHAIRMNCNMPAYLFGLNILIAKVVFSYYIRAACHLKLGNHIKCIEDCSKALELLDPPVQQNATSRCRAHIRRGTAFCQLELYAEGLQDYEAALKIEPGNEQLMQDADRIRTIILGPQPT